jgi:hypothetical protein
MWISTPAGCRSGIPTRRSALQAGVPAKVVAERLGHATVAFTLDVYSHVIPALQEDAAERIAALVDVSEPNASEV